MLEHSIFNVQKLPINLTILNILKDMLHFYITQSAIPFKISCSDDRHSIDTSSRAMSQGSSSCSHAAKSVFTLIASAHNPWDWNSHSCIEAQFTTKLQSGM
jgi:hypothetical protein